jgi:hypothetical protein
MALTKDDLQAIGTLITASEKRMEKRFNTKIDAVSKKVDAIDKRFDQVDEKLEKIWLELIKYTGELHQDHEKRIQKLEQRVYTPTTL